MSFLLKIGDHTEIATALFGAFQGPRPVYCGGRYWQYAKGVWRTDVGRKTDVLSAIEKGVMVLSGTPVGDTGKFRADESAINGVERVVRRLAKDETFFNDAPVGVCARNGFLTLKDGFVPHDPGHRARFAVNCDYDPAATCPAFIEFLAGRGLRPNEIACIQEFFGTALFGKSCDLQQALVIQGGGSTGRSTLLKILETFFDEPTHLSPQELSRPFSLIKLQGKRLNTTPEMPSRAMLDDVNSIWKKVVDGTPVTAEEKYEKGVEFNPIAGWAVLPQEQIRTNDLSHGFWRRFAVMVFAKEISRDDAIRDIDERILATDRAGILAWLVEGARRAIPRGRYVEPESHAETLAAWKLNCDVVGTYLAEAFDFSDGAKKMRVPASALYQHFVRWCQENGHTKPHASNTFAGRLKELKVPFIAPHNRKFYGLAPRDEQGFFGGLGKLDDWREQGAA